MPPASTVDWIALGLLPGVGPVAARRLLDRFSDPAVIAFGVPARHFRGLPGITTERVAAIEETRKTLRRQAEKEMRRCEKAGFRVISCVDPDYPAALAELPDRPTLIYVAGRIDPGVLRVAVVGSRHPTAYGRRVATGLCSGLAGRGIEVVSGGARGIDTISHRAALDAGGRTVSVLGSGLLDPYPPDNDALFEQIADAGAVVSEFPLETPPHPSQFPRRNRLVSGLAAAVVVVEAARKSGSLITASLALDQGREVLAVPGPVSSSRSEGCNRLIQQGAKLVQQVEDILDELPPIFRQAALGPPAAPDNQTTEVGDLAPDEAVLLGILDPVEPLHVDELADRAPFGVARLQAALFSLEFRGAVEQSPGRYYVSRLRRDP